MSMASPATMPASLLTLRRFFRTPKGLLIALFVPLTTIAVLAAGSGTIQPVAVGALSAVVVDLAIVWGTDDALIFPSGALLTGLLVAFVLAPQEPLVVIGVTAGVAIASKRLLRMRATNIFNPAALALVVSAIAFESGQSWWGSLPSLGLPGVLVLLALGLTVAQHINKLPLVLSFLAAYFLVFTGVSLFGNPAQVAEVFRTPDANAALFFACFMLDDPPTCPVRYDDQVVFGLVTAGVSTVVFLLFGSVYYLFAGLLVANLYAAARREWQTRARAGARVTQRPDASPWAKPSSSRVRSDALR